jgi:hypothetical protein
MIKLRQDVGVVNLQAEESGCKKVRLRICFLLFLRFNLWRQVIHHTGCLMHLDIMTLPNQKKKTIIRVILGSVRRND